MIEIQKAKRALKEYVKQYEQEDQQIKLKMAHIQRTSQIAKKIAQHLSLSEEEIQLAELIGLLHDIGRFEQIKKYHTFVDRKSVNHGEFGVQILFEEGLIRNFIKDTQYDTIIKTAILNHNRGKEKIEAKDEIELRQSQIIRDADKVDIFYIITTDKIETIYETNDLTNETISDEIYQGYLKEHRYLYGKASTKLDAYVSHFSYVYDLNYPYALQIIQENNYLDKLYHRFKFQKKETKERCYRVYEIAKRFLETEIEERQKV